MGSENPHRIIVGVDGSRSSQAALTWSLWHAQLSHGTVMAVMSWEYPELYDWTMPSVSEVTDRTAAELASTVLNVVEPEHSNSVDQRVTEGHPATALLRAVSEENADLLVVGNRGHGGFTEAILGSIGQYCVYYAACPVVVVRASGEERG